MSNIVTSLFGFSSRAIETSLILAQSAMRNAQSAIERLTGQETSTHGAPVEGYEDLDHALADFADRLARVYRYTPRELSQLPAASGEIMRAARESFRNLTGRSISPALPVQVMLSLGTLFTQSALRGLISFEVAGPARIPRLLDDIFELFTEAPVFTGLEYGELIERCEKRLAGAPDDHRLRMELARVLSKCGRYEDAALEYRKIPPSSNYYHLAMHEAGVALYRAGRLEEAIRAEVQSMDADPSDERPRSVMFQAAHKLGGYPAFVPEDHRMEMKAGYATPGVVFEDVAVKIGLNKTSGGRGIAVLDGHKDGFLDVVIASAFGGASLYRNNGDGTFTDVSVGSGLDTAVNTFAVIAGDYNNDGLTDLYFTRAGFYVGDGQLFRNNGDGTFTDVTKEAGLENVWGPSFTSAWVDYDNDGCLDLYVSNNLGGLFERKTPNRLFHNNGDGTFTDVTVGSGLETIWPTIGCTWGDYDNDGLMDLFLSNGIGRAQLFHNNGDGTFTDVSAEAGIDDKGFGSPAFFWDYDNDGWLDIGQFIWSDHDDVIYTMRHGEAPPRGQVMRVYHNNRDGTFTLVSREVGLNECWGTMSGSFGDFNNDGYLDLALGNGSPRLERLDPMVIFESDGKRFRNTTFSAGLPFTGKSHGVNMADLFGDGRLSILVAAGGFYPGDLLTTKAYCPKTLPGNYLNVRLVGVKSNRSAIGARVVLESAGGRQLREVSGGTNFGCLPLEQHFGLNGTANVDAIEVRWPSGIWQRFKNLPINNTIEITEGESNWKDVYGKPATDTEVVEVTVRANADGA